MKRFDKTIKEEACHPVLDKSRPVASVAWDLGIHENTLHKWLAEYKVHQGQTFPGIGKLKPQDEELRQLKKRLADLDEENAFLKKATAIFAKHQK